MHELTYPLLQAYDFKQLSYVGVDAQVAGIDQINNVKLGRRMIGNGCGIFVDLIVDKTGNKLGKTSSSRL
ncbi:MAG: hypothetical protein GY771_04410 [bacterium]|nr:hypothetical protein [bacterium]